MRLRPSAESLYQAVSSLGSTSRPLASVWIVVAEVGKNMGERRATRWEVMMPPHRRSIPPEPPAAHSDIASTLSSRNQRLADRSQTSVIVSPQVDSGTS